jgi:hypothetical protein
MSSYRKRKHGPLMHQRSNLRCGGRVFADSERREFFVVRLLQHRVSDNLCCLGSLLSNENLDGIVAPLKYSNQNAQLKLDTKVSISGTTCRNALQGGSSCRSLACRYLLCRTLGNFLLFEWLFWIS